MPLAPDGAPPPPGSARVPRGRRDPFRPRPTPPALREVVETSAVIPENLPLARLGERELEKEVRRFGEVRVGRESRLYSCPSPSGLVGVVLRYACGHLGARRQVQELVGPVRVRAGAHRPGDEDLGLR